MTAAFAAETALLTSPEAAVLLQAALTGSTEIALPGFTAQLDDLHYRPGAEVTAIYTVTYALAGQPPCIEHLVATSAEVAGGAVTLVRDGVTLRVWRHPADPRLPGLAPACDPATVLAWLVAARPGLAPTALHVELLAYRPLRRAVLRAEADEDHWFVKVMRPGYDDRLVARQELLSAAGLTVEVDARPAPGVVVSPRVPGRSLAEVIVAAGAGEGGVPGPEAVIEALDRLPDTVLDLPRRPSWSDRLDFHAATARQHLPSEVARINTVAARISAVLAQRRISGVVPTHGDLYEANVFVDGDRVRFIDVDSVGPGLREDDLACCLAHLAVLPGIDPDAYAEVPGLLTAWQEEFERRVDPRDLRARTAAVLLSLISGADPDQAQRRLGLAEKYAGP